MSRRGQSLVESALVLAAFMGLLLGMAAVGQSLFVRQTLADRARIAARWGALNTYNPEAIRSMILQAPSFGLTPESVEVSNPGCPGPACRVSVTIPEQGIRSVEPVESSTPDLAATPDLNASKP